MSSEFADLVFMNEIGYLSATTSADAPRALKRKISRVWNKLSPERYSAPPRDDVAYC